MRKREIKAVLFARITPDEKNLKPDRFKHKLDGLEIFCNSKGYTVLSRCGYIALANDDYFELEEFLRMMSKSNPRPNILLICSWKEFPDDLIQSVQLIMKCQKFGVMVHTQTELCVSNTNEKPLGWDEDH